MEQKFKLDTKLQEPASAPRKWFAIVDCNSFYCSCERVFRPDLLHKPVVVLSNNDGCIVSRSDEAKKLGVGMAEPYFQSMHIIKKNDIAVFSSNYHLYGDMSWRVMETLRQLAPAEVYSVDEAFLSLDNFSSAQLHAYAKQIKETVEQWTGISVSVGIAPTKTLAKIANHMAKKNKQATNCIKVMDTDESRIAALQQTRVSAIWGIGGAYANKLINWGITNALELSLMPEPWAHKNLGGVVGLRLIKELNGEPSITMAKELTEKKMIATTRMFGRPVSALSELKEAVATYISRAAEKLRRQRGAAKNINVFLVPRESDHSANFHYGGSVSANITLSSASSLTNELIKLALQLVEDLFEEGKQYKKAGVMLSGLEPDKSIQGNLFHSGQDNMHRFLMSAIDNVNFSMRDDPVKFCSTGINKNWKMRQELRSERYSTRWAELRTVV
ncbi:MAG: Y-family DNA polymerase [Bacteroidetes bacterium]|nr:Y-family DNA polymerase [Bacteroidota bacterium]